jgi:hypothetical protein
MTMSGQHDSAASPAATPERRAPISRRAALRGGAAAGVAGAALVAAGSPALAAVTHAAKAPTPASDARAHEAGPADTLVVHVRDARTGEIDIFRGTAQTRVRDRALAAQLLRASR